MPADLPFYLGGSRAWPGSVLEAQNKGAQGIQVGSIFALCEESGFLPEVKRRVYDEWRTGRLVVLTDLHASPTGYPIKVAQLPETQSEEAVYESRERRCHLGCLRVPYLKPDGTMGYRCASEPVGDFVKKGGKREDTLGARCLCEALLNAILEGFGEPMLVTLGDDLSFLNHLPWPYTAEQAMEYLLQS